MIEFFDVLAGSDVGVSRDDPTMMVFGIGKPDWIRVPAAAGGGVVRCTGVVIGACPLPDHGEECRHFILEGPVGCAECVIAREFVWYTRSRVLPPQATMGQSDTE